MPKNVILKDLITKEVWYPQTTMEQVTDLETTLNTYAKVDSVESVVDDIETLQETIESLVSKDELNSGLSDLKNEIFGEDLSDTFNTLKAVENWATTHGTEYTTLVTEVDKRAFKSDVTDLDLKVGTIEGKVNSVDSKKVNVTDYNSKVGELEDSIDNKVSQEEYESRILNLEQQLSLLSERLSVIENKEYSNIIADIPTED